MFVPKKVETGLLWIGRSLFKHERKWFGFLGHAFSRSPGKLTLYESNAWNSKLRTTIFRLARRGLSARGRRKSKATTHKLSLTSPVTLMRTPGWHPRQPRAIVSIQPLEERIAPDSTPPTFNNVTLNGVAGGGTVTLNVGQLATVSGSISDTGSGMGKITFQTSTPVTPSFNIVSNNVSGTSVSVAGISFDSGNTTYCGVIGTSHVSLFGKDVAGNVSSKTWTINVVDNVGPTFNNVLLNGVAGGGTVTINLGQVATFSGSISDTGSGMAKITEQTATPVTPSFNIVSKNVSGTSVSLSGYSFDSGNTAYCGVVGTSYVTIFAKDVAGNLTSKTWTINVVDNVGPTFNNVTLNGVAAGGTVTLNLNSVATFSGTISDTGGLSKITEQTATPVTPSFNIVSNNVSGTSVSVAGLSFDSGNTAYCGVVGTSYVTIFAKDVAGNLTSKTWTINVVDNVSPSFNNVLLNGVAGGGTVTLTLGQIATFSGTISDPGGLSKITEQTSSSVTPSFDIVSNNVSGTSVSVAGLSFDSGNTAYCGVIGTAYVTIFAKDTAGNLSSKTWTINVVDGAGPAFNNVTLNGVAGGGTVTLTLGQVATFSGTISDPGGLSKITEQTSSSVTPSFDIVSNNVSGTSVSVAGLSFDSGNTAYCGVIGTAYVTIFAKDTAGNLSSKTWTIIVVGGAPPTPSDGFDYPIGNRGYNSLNQPVPMLEFADGSSFPETNNLYPSNPSPDPDRSGSTRPDWFNLQDTGSYYHEPGGIHPGEDWNLNSGDVGESVFAMADGKIVKIVPTSTSPSAWGWTIVVLHTLSNGEKYYSLYVHVTHDANNTAGAIATSAGQFSYSVGSLVTRNLLIARIANIAKPHFHGEVRRYVRDLSGSAALYPTGNGNGYYTDQVGVPRNNGMTQAQVTLAYGLMMDEGFVDMSDFINAHRPGTSTTAPTVSSVVFGDGTQHRSLVKQIVVNFSEPVNFMGSVASCFTLHRTGTGGAIGDVALSANPSSGPASAVTITFSGSITEAGGSLVDGLYDFTISAAQVSGPGSALDGNSDGIAGGSYLVTGSTTNKYFRLFGDSDGSGQVDFLVDLMAFRNAFGNSGSNAIFDFNNSGQVDYLADYVAFRNRFSMTL